MIKNISTTRIILSYFAIYIIWGANFVGILFAIQSIPPFITGGLRFLIAGIILFAISLLKGDTIPTKSQILSAIKIGFYLNVVGTGSLLWAEQFVPSGIASIIVATGLIWIIIIDTDNWKKNFSSLQLIIGVLLGLGGIIILSNMGEALKLNNTYYIGLIVLIAGSVSWAIGSIISKKSIAEGSLIGSLAIQFISAGIAFFILSFGVGDFEKFTIQEVTMTSWLALWFMIVFATVIGYLAYQWLLSVRPAHEVATHTFINPVVAVLLGVLLAGEVLNINIIFAMGFVLLAVLFIRFPRKIEVLKI